MYLAVKQILPEHRLLTYCSFTTHTPNKYFPEIRKGDQLMSIQSLVYWYCMRYDW